MKVDIAERLMELKEGEYPTVNFFFPKRSWRKVLTTRKMLFKPKLSSWGK